MKNLKEFINESLPNRIDWKEIKLSDNDKKNIIAFSYKKNGELYSLEQTTDFIWKLKSKSKDTYKDLNETINGLLSQLNLTKKDIIKIEKLPKDSNEVYLNAMVIRDIAIAQKLNN